MKATVWKSNLCWGIRVGNENRDKHFSKKHDMISVKIDGINYAFDLNRTFWTTCPEFRGKAISEWVKRHSLNTKTQVRLEVIEPYKKFRLLK